MIKLLQAQALVLQFREEDRPVRYLADYKRCYKRGALLLAQRRLEDFAQACANSMKELNGAWDALKEYFKHHEVLEMPKSLRVEEDVCRVIEKIDPLHYASVPSFRSRETLLCDRYSIIETDSLRDILNKAQYNHYVRTANIEVCVTKGIYGSFRFTDLTGAFQSKSQCVSYTLAVRGCLGVEDGQDLRDKLNFCSILNMVWTHVVSDSFKDIWAWLQSLDGFNDKGSRMFVYDNVQIECIKCEEKGSDLFSPFHLERVKPVDVLPPKPNKKHVYRMLVNGQFSALKQDYHYNSDDGSGRGSYKDHEGYSINPFHFADALSDRFGTVSFGKGFVTVYEGSNTWSTFKIELDNRYFEEDIDVKEVCGLIA